MDNESTVWGIDPIVAVQAPKRYALTIAFHPDFSRIGATALLEGFECGDQAQISRLNPLFTLAHSQRSPSALDDLYISRKPLLLERTASGVLVTPNPMGSPVSLNGHRLEAAFLVPDQSIEQGIVIDLGQRVILILHCLSQELPSASMHGMFGVSQSIEEVRRSIDRVADLDVPVLVRGATGTGKELVAAALHRASMRAESKMVAINVAAIPASLAISELFGVKKGAYTGATADKPGYFVQAHGSTLFLDEIGDADDEVQVALLRTLETGEVQAVGGKDFVQVDVRLIAATDADLESKMSSSDFRNPLLQRLAGFEIWLPPLAERKPDICILFAAFIRQEFDAIGESLRYRVLDAESTAFWFALFIRALNYPWTGNVREMRNMARQIAINNRQSMVLSLPPRIHHALFVMDRTQGAKIASDDVGLSPGENAHLAEPAQLSNPAQLSKPTQLRRKPSTVTEVELQAALEAQRWDLKNTAEMLHISRAALYKMIDAHPEIRKAGDIGVLELTEINRRYQGNLDAMVEVLKVSKSALKRRLKELSLS